MSIVAAAAFLAHQLESRDHLGHIQHTGLGCGVGATIVVVVVIVGRRGVLPAE